MELTAQEESENRPEAPDYIESRFFLRKNARLYVTPLMSKSYIINR